MNIYRMPRLMSALLVLLLMGTGCTSSYFNKGKKLMQAREFDRAVEAFQAAAESDPDRLEYWNALHRAKQTASQDHFEKAKRFIARGMLENAIRELDMALTLDPTNKYAQDQLVRAVEEVKRQEDAHRKKDLTIAEMKKELSADDGRPKLRADANIPIVLKFNERPISEIFDAISKASGINFLYDERAEQDKRITVDLAQVTMEQAMDHLMMLSGHFFKVLDENTIIVVPDNKNKRTEYEDQVIKTFYLSNADAKEVFQVVRTLVDSRRAAQNKDLNSITIRDTPEKIAIIERIVNSMDKSKGEVIVNVELLEVNQTRLKNLGIDFGSSTTFSPESSSLNLLDIGDVPKKAFWSVSIPSIAISYLKQDSDARILARPQVRVAEDAKANIHIGDRVPIPTTQFQNVGGTGNLQPITSFTYQDVGVRINLEPKVHHNKEVTLKLKVNVSSVTGQVESSNGPAQPLIGQREIETEIRLLDGETNLLGGLFREENGESYTGVPGLGDIPILKRLFGRQSDRTTTTDIILLLTPHIVRVPDIGREDLEPLFIGTEDRVQIQGDFHSSFSKSPFKADEDTPMMEEGIKPAADEDSSKDPERKPAPPRAEPVTPEPQLEPVPEEVTDPDDFQQEPPAANPTVDLSPDLVRQKVGKDLRINLSVLNGQNLNLKSGEVQINYDPEVLEFKEPESGFLLRMGGKAAVVTQQELGPGRLLVKIERDAADGVSSSGVLVRFRFTLKKEGESTVNCERITLTTATGGTFNLQTQPVAVKPL